MILASSLPHQAVKVRLKEILAVRLWSSSLGSAPLYHQKKIFTNDRCILVNRLFIYSRKKVDHLGFG